MSRFLSILKTIAQLLGSYLLILLIAGLAAVPVYNILEPIIGRDFDRYVDRMRYLGLLFLLPLWWRWAKLSWRKLGWSKFKTGMLFVLLGMMSVVFTGLVASIYNQTISSSGEAPMNSLWLLLPLVGKGLLIGLVVALIEETVFRGVMQNMCVRGCGPRFGIWLAAIVFAWMHGRPHMDWFSQTIDWGDGLRMAWAYVSTMPKNMTVTELMNLTMLGGLVGMLYYKSKSLWLPIGFHMGIVAAVVFVNEVVIMCGLVPVGEALTELPITTVMLSVWVVGVVVWPDQSKGVVVDSAKGNSA